MATPDFETYCQQLFDHKTAAGKPEVLKGYRVLSCTQYILGPSCAAYLAELGAEVIKIETPRRGEPMRHTTPFNEPLLFPLSRWVPEAGTGLGFFGANTTRSSSPSTSTDRRRRQAFWSWRPRSDVMVQNFRPGTFDRWGIGYSISPRSTPASSTSGSAASAAGAPAASGPPTTSWARPWAAPSGSRVKPPTGAGRLPSTRSGSSTTGAA